MSTAGYLERLLARLVESPVETDAKDLEGSVRETGGTCLVDAEVGTTITVTGRVRTVATPGDRGIGLVAEVFDGTDSIDVCWVGRRSLAGIDTGRYLRVSGRMGLRDGRRIMYNPRYELLECRPGTPAKGAA